MTPDLDELYTALQQVKVYECSLRDAKFHLDGLQEGADTIYVDPRPAIIETLVHELLHVARPTWSEAAVRRHTSRLFRRQHMTEATMRKWWLAYRRVKRKGCPVEVEE